MIYFKLSVLIVLLIPSLQLKKGLTNDTDIFSVKTTGVGVMKIRFIANTTISSELITQCSIYNLANQQVVICNNGSCDCLGDTIIELQENTEYRFIFSLMMENLYELSVRTASFGNLKAYYGVETLAFKITYPDNSKPPSACKPCTRPSQEHIDTDDCKEIIKEYIAQARFCTFYYHEMTLYGGVEYDTILFDEYFDKVGELRRVKVVESELIQTSSQLQSIGYKMETELFYNPEFPCMLLDAYYDIQKCEVDQEITMDCPCDKGKIVQLPENRNIYIEVYQNLTLLAYKVDFTTASKGDFKETKIGLNIFEYSINYERVGRKPDFCIACLIPTSENKDNECTNYSPVVNMESCVSHTFDNLINGTSYKLIIFDGDKSLHTEYTFTTNGYPNETKFTFGKDFTTYKLIFSSTNEIPRKCIVLFKEDRNFPVECEFPGCMCEEGTVLLPEEREDLTDLVIENELGQILAYIEKYTETISIGMAIGIAIGGLLLIVIVVLMITGLVIFIIRREKYKRYKSKN